MSTPPQTPLIFNFDISCPFAYIASTRVPSLSQRTNTPISYRPVLLGAIYRATSAPQGAGGSASDVFNSTKRAVTAQSMARTLKRYRIAYNPPSAHPMKSVDALRMLYCVEDGEERRRLMQGLFKAYWVQERDVRSRSVLLDIAAESGIHGLTESCFTNASARTALEEATAEAIERGAFGVPGFWIPDAKWVDASGEERVGRYFWGQDRMHFVEATLLTRYQANATWSSINNLESLMPRCIPLPTSPPSIPPTRLEFYFDFSSPWAYLAFTQLPRLQHLFGPSLTITLKPFLLGILFREIGAPNMPMLAVSPTKAAWSRQDHADWVRWWNSVGKTDKIDFKWADTFPIRTPTVLRVGIARPETMGLLYSACWEKNENVSDESVLADVLTKGGYDGPALVKMANAPEIKAKLRANTAEAKEMGICGVPTYRVLRQHGTDEWKPLGGLIWGQDETNVVEDLIAGWVPETSDAVAEPRKGEKVSARL
ncbi:thioredoxin-like protein [Phaeosphaeria sp. MPI-PUGE-AT-0046c]|nr:thioredoxin-like protein [Phaeosphaeria sp. MPI-PUGE-AT-0046c]